MVLGSMPDASSEVDGPAPGVESMSATIGAAGRVVERMGFDVGRAARGLWIAFDFPFAFVSVNLTTIRLTLHAAGAVHEVSELTLRLSSFLICLSVSSSSSSTRLLNLLSTSLNARMLR